MFVAKQFHYLPSDVVAAGFEIDENVGDLVGHDCLDVTSQFVPLAAFLQLFNPFVHHARDIAAGPAESIVHIVREIGHLITNQHVPLGCRAAQELEPSFGLVQASECCGRRGRVGQDPLLGAQTSQDLPDNREHIADRTRDGRRFCRRDDVVAEMLHNFRDTAQLVERLVLALQGFGSQCTTHCDHR